MNNYLCRICCENEGIKYIFDEDGESKISNKLLYFCVNIEVKEDDGLPNKICTSCEEDLTFCYQFVLRCEAAYNKCLSMKNVHNLNSDAIVKEENSPHDLVSDLLHDGDDDRETGTYYDLEDKQLKISLENSNIKNENAVDTKVFLHSKKKRKKSIKGKERCTECGRVCKNSSTLVIHMRTHTSNKPYTCKLCDKKYKDSGNLNRHMARKHLHEQRERRFVCEACGNRFYNKSCLITHMRIHTRETPYPCPICPKKFTQKSALIRHKVRHTGEKPYTCNNCVKSFSTKDELKRHFQTHTTEKKYPCLTCNRFFKFKGSLNKHLKNHTRESGFVCNYCGRTFNAKGNLKIHIDRLHSEKSGHCNICQKNVSNLEVHMRKHTGERPLKCELCSSTFFEQNGLAHHINFRHKNTTKYKCSTEGCLETFPSQPMLEFHIAKHHGTHIPFPCVRCSRGFYRKNDLARHMIGTHKEKLKF